MTGYTDTIRRWAIDTRRSGSLPDADGTGEVGLGPEEAGRRLAVRFALKIKKDRVATVRFEVFGCGFTIAACAAAAELAEGQPLSALDAITPGDVEGLLEGLPSERTYCAELAIEALHAAAASARDHQPAVIRAVVPRDEHKPRLTANHPVYSALMKSAPPDGVATEDRHLFACLLSVATQEPGTVTDSLGLTTAEISALLTRYYPDANRKIRADLLSSGSGPIAESHDGLLAILLPHVPQDGQGHDVEPSLWLARIIAARSALPGHLWIAMGLFQRPELTESIRRHLPTLAAANDQGMRWKRYLFKQICDLGGGSMCKAPDCGTCSDYAICFAPED